MKRNSLATALAAALALSGGAVFAEGGTNEPGAAQGAAMKDATQKVGSAVFDSTGRQVGTIDEVVTDEQGGKHAVVSVGTFLGLGERKILVPAARLSENVEQTGYQVDMTAEEIEAAPEYSPPQSTQE